MNSTFDTNKQYQVVSPFDSSVLNTYDYESLKSVESKIEGIKKQKLLNWKNLRVEERLAKLSLVNQEISNQATQLAETLHQEMGKSLPEARGEVRKSTTLFDYYERIAEETLTPKTISLTGNKTAVSYHSPFGLILGIMPWNFPFWQSFRFAIPTLLAGNGVLIKGAPNVAGCTRLLADIFNVAPEVPFEIIETNHTDTEYLIQSGLIDGLSFTGSSRAGVHLSKIAATRILPTVLELGGSDPYVILKDADLDLAVKKCVMARFLNNGQSCISAKRWIIASEIYDEFLEKAENEIKRIEMKPLARIDLQQGLHQQVKMAIQKGARCVLGGKIPDSKGSYYPPTLLSNMSEDSEIFNQEFFGPVACAWKATSEEHAVEIANQSPFGLGGAVFSIDQARAEQVALRIDTGMVAINDMLASTPEVPFGGIKQSGLGLELGEEGLCSFTHLKTVMK